MSKDKLPTIPEPTIPPELMDMRTVVSQAFQGSGGIAALTKWIRSSGTNRGQFYSQLLGRMVALPPTQATQVNISVENDKAERDNLEHKLIDSLANAIRVAREDRAAETARTGLIELDGVVYRKGDNGTLTPTNEVPPLPPGTHINPFTGERLSPGVVIIDNCPAVDEASRETDAPMRETADISRETTAHAPQPPAPSTPHLVHDRDRAAAVDRDRARRTEQPINATTAYYEWIAQGGGDRFGGT